MTSVLVPSDVGQKVIELCALHIRVPTSIDSPPDQTTTLHFTPDLSTDDAAKLADLIAWLRYEGFISFADYRAIRAEVPTLQAYAQQPNPTAAQTVTATMAIIAVLRALLRD